MSPTLWHAIAALVSIVCLIGLSLDLRRQALPRVLVFVVYALFFRFLLSAFHTYTFPPVAGPFSINALYSLLVIGLGVLVINRRLLLLRFLLPVHGVMIVSIVSALYNGTLTESIQSLLKWAFFIVIALAVYESLLRSDRIKVLENLLKSFSIPIILQLLSVALGYSKRNEIDNSTSYLGGYNHEAVFSVMLVAALMLAALRQMLNPPTARMWRFLPILLAGSVMLANYRTNILTMLLPLGGFLWFRFFYGAQPLARMTGLAALTAGMAVIAIVDFSALVARFSEIGTVLEKASSLIKSPRYYTPWEQDYFSSRLYIWSQYIDGYMNSNFVQHLIGMGPDTWSELFPKYAHNTFISSLYELGLLGTLLLAYFFLAGLRRSLTSPYTTYSILLFLGLLGFLVMNLGTMPLWQIEGMILFAILNALTWERSLQPHAAKAPRPASAPLQHPGVA